MHTLDAADTAQDAALLMSRHGIRHVPVTERRAPGRHRLRARPVRAAAAVAQAAGRAIRAAPRRRRAARSWPPTSAASRATARPGRAGAPAHRADQPPQRPAHRAPGANWSRAQRGLDLDQACWLAFGSEGRGEQTIATDQDNGLVFVSDDPTPTGRAGWRWRARSTRRSTPAATRCARAGDGRQPRVLPDAPPSGRSASRTGSSTVRREDLLKASIYFDLRPLAGNRRWPQPLRAMLARRPRRSCRVFSSRWPTTRCAPRAVELARRLETQEVDGRAMLDLKLQGTAIFVDAARLYALAHGLAALGTRRAWRRPRPACAWRRRKARPGSAASSSCRCCACGCRSARRRRPRAGQRQPRRLGHAQRHRPRMLKETLRVARRLQQRIELDYGR